MLFSYGIGFIYILLGLAISGNLADGFRAYAEKPLHSYGYTILFSLSGYFGVSFILNLIGLFGALTTVTVTTCRKAFTIILSFLLFAKPFTVQYVWSGLVVLLGIAINVYQKNRAVVNEWLWEVKHKYFCKSRKKKFISQTV